jgi:hypothetical protein
MFGMVGIGTSLRGKKGKQISNACVSQVWLAFVISFSRPYFPQENPQFSLLNSP